MDGHAAFAQLPAAEPPFEFDCNPALNFGPSIWPVVNAMVAAHPGTINLGQGFPDWSPPDFVVQAAQAAVSGGPLMHQYARSMGTERLVRALAARLSPALGVELDGLKNVCISVGGCEALCAAIFAVVKRGTCDEVVLLEPCFDCYDKQVRLAGGRPVFVPLQPVADCDDANAWALSEDALASVLSERTAALIINTPQNPLGKVWSRAELEMVARVVRRHRQLVVIADEVYQYLAYDGLEHVSIASLPGMWERTMTVGSAGKVFCCTGYKVGWIVANERLTQACWLARQWTSFCVATPMQEAVAAGFESDAFSSYTSELRAQLADRRTRLEAALRRAGLRPIASHGSYFTMCDIARFAAPGLVAHDDPTAGADVRLCRFLIARYGLACIPAARPFFSEAHAAAGACYARFAFCKSDAVIDAAIARLDALATDRAALTDSHE